MFGSSTEEVGDTSGCGLPWGESPMGRSQRNETTSYGPASVSSGSSHRGLEEGSASSGHGSSLPQVASGDP